MFPAVPVVVPEAVGLTLAPSRFWKVFGPEPPAFVPTLLGTDAPGVPFALPVDPFVLEPPEPVRLGSFSGFEVVCDVLLGAAPVVDVPGIAALEGSVGFDVVEFVVVGVFGAGPAEGPKTLEVGTVEFAAPLVAAPDDVPDETEPFGPTPFVPLAPVVLPPELAVPPTLELPVAAPPDEEPPVDPALEPPAPLTEPPLPTLDPLDAPPAPAA